VLSAVGLRSERGPILAAMMLATALIAIDTTVLATAVPAVVKDLGGFEAFPWLFSIYLLTMTVLVPVYSKLADTIGRRPLMLFGIAVFLVASILCGFAWDMPSLIIFRALQGIGAGAIQPLTITVIGDIYSIEERARIQGYIGSVWAAASIIGPTLGAIFSELDAWRWIFFINIPLCLIAGWLVLRNLKESLPKRRHRIDYLGAILLTLGLTALVLAILEGGHAWAWDSWESFALFGGSGLALIAFFWTERHAAEPVLPLAIFRRPVIAASTSIGFVFGVALIGLTAYTPTYLQVGAGVSPFIGGLALAAMLLGWPIASAISGRLFLTRGFRFTIGLGAVLALAGAIGLAATASVPNPWLVAGMSLVIGFGFGWCAAPTLVAAQASVPWEERAVATGTIMFSRSFGQAIGAAILGAVANSVIADHGGDSTDPGTIIAASTAVFVAVAAVLVLHFGLALAFPSQRRLTSTAGWAASSLTARVADGTPDAPVRETRGMTASQAEDRAGLPEPGEHPELEQLIAVLEHLRAPGGCAWDREQTHASLVRYLVEETHELVEAIEAGDDDELVEELGDVLYQVVFHADIAAEEGRFTLEDVARRMRRKMVGRHPHVFGDAVADTADAVTARWDELKRTEKPHRDSVLDGVPKGMPALALADKLLGKAQQVGVGRAPAEVAADEERLGDALLGIVAGARAAGLDPERALRGAIRRLEDDVRAAETRRRGDSA